MCMCEERGQYYDEMSQKCIPFEECPGTLECPANEVWNSCGTACPAVCGEPREQFCIEMCVDGMKKFQIRT